MSAEPEGFPTRLDEIDTPAPLLDLDLFESNASEMSGFLGHHGMAWRPHIKSHRSPYLARLQVELGAIGVTAATLDEAELMVTSGIADVLLANHLGTRRAWERIAALQHHGKVSVCVDNPLHIELASAAAVAEEVEVPIFIEVDVGMRRVGVSNPEDAEALARGISAAPNLDIAGMMGYEGHLLRDWPEPDKIARCRAALSVLTDSARRVRDAGLEVPIVSSGGTGSYQQTAGMDLLTESQAGGGCLMDIFYSQECHVELDHALTAFSTVVSVRGNDHAVMDAGFKVLGSLGTMPLPHVVGRPDVEVSGLSAAHGRLRPTDPERGVSVGDRLRLIPGYSDAMLATHTSLIAHRGDEVIGRILLNRQQSAVDLRQ